MSLALLGLALLAVPNPWHLVGPGGGGWIQAVAYSPHHADTLFVGCDVGGFYRSDAPGGADDGGRSFTILNDGLRDRWVEAIVPHPTDPDVLYVGTLTGVHRSDDGGRSWRLLRNGFPELSGSRYTAPIGSLVLDPQRPDVLYAGIGIPRRREGGQGALYRSADGGESWTRQNPPGSLPDDAIVSDILLRPDGSLLIATQHGLFASADEGVSWAPRNEGLANRHTRYLAASAADPQRLYVTVESTAGAEPFDGGVWRSDDGGLSWRRVIEGLNTGVRPGNTNRNLTSQYDRIVADPRDADIVYVGGAAWVNAETWKTTDGGETWASVTRRGDAPNMDLGYITFWGPSVKCLALNPRDPARVVFGTSGHVIETRDGGATWQQRYTESLGDGAWRGNGLEVTCIWTLAPHPLVRDNWFLGYMDIGLWQTHDAGETLRSTREGIAGEHHGNGLAFGFDPADPERVWGGFGQWGNNTGALYASADGGRAWTRVDGLPDAQITRIVPDPASDPADRRLWVALNGPGVWVGNAASGGWREMNEGLPGGRVVDLDRVSDALLALVDGTYEIPGGLFRREPGRDTWQRVEQAPLVGNAHELAVSADPQRLYLALRTRKAGEAVLPGGLYVSNDAGRTWRRSFDFHFVSAVDAHPTDPDTAVLGTTDHPYHDEPIARGVWLTRDGGETWVDLSEGLTITEISEVRFDPHDPERIIVGTGGNSVAWRRLPES